MGKLICCQCGTIYESCPSCENANYYAWRNNFCSRKCFILNLEGEKVKMDRMQYDGKIFKIKKSDFQKGIFTISDGKNELTVKESDDKIQGFIFTQDTYFKLKNFKEAVTKKVSNKKEVHIKMADKDNAEE